MASDDNSGAKPAGPVVLRIKLRYDDLDAMVQRFAPNVGKSGLFLPTKSIQPIGTEVKFELRLSNDTPALVGIGKVKHVKPPDPKNPKATFGMAIELMRVSREGREVIIRMIERRRALGLADVAIPIPEDAEKAQRNDVDTQPRAETSGIVKEAMAQFASAPVSDAIMAAPPSGPIAVAKEPIAKEPRFTAARDSGPIKVVASLAPEPARAKRPRVADLIAKAGELSGPLAAAPIPGLDEHVDVEAAMVRARALAAGADLEAELASLLDSAAAPVEISIDAASAELARQLGGTAITKRDRSARWAPPPAVETKPSPPPVEEAPAPPPPPIEDVAPPPPEDIAPAADEDDGAFAPSPVTTTATEPGQDVAHELAPAPPAMLIDDHVDSNAFERAYSDAERLHSGEYELIGDDEDRGERTVIGAMPVDPNAFQGHAFATTPNDQLADQLDRQLDEAEREADADVSQGFQAEYPYAQQPAADVAAPEEQVSDVDVLAEADEGDADLLGASGESDASREAPAYQDPYPEAQPVADQLAAVQLPEDLGDDLPPPDEFDREAAEEFDRESAREFDRDLQSTPVAAPEQEPERQSVSDFAARLDLGDDEELPPVADPPPPVVPAFAPRRARRASSNNDFPDPPSSSYTFAEQFPQAALHPHESTLDRVLAEAGEGEDFDEPHSYGQPPPQPPQPPQPMNYEPPTVPPPRHAQQRAAQPAESLDDALSALDVDLDDIHLEPPKRPSSTGQRPLPGLPIHRPTGPNPIVPKPVTGPVRTVAHTVKRQTGSRPTQPPPPPPQAFRKTPTQQVPVTPPPQPPKRATTDDGIVIDFDDDE